MKPFALRLALAVVLDAVALWIASLVLDNMSINGAGFVIAVIIFSVAQAVALPLARALVKEYASRLALFVSLIVTFVALLVADLLSDGLSIEGALTWILATLIVWAAGIVLELLTRNLIPRGGQPAAS